MRPTVGYYSTTWVHLIKAKHFTFWNLNTKPQDLNRMFSFDFGLYIASVNYVLWFAEKYQLWLSVYLHSVYIWCIFRLNIYLLSVYLHKLTFLQHIAMVTICFCNILYFYIEMHRTQYRESTFSIKTCHDHQWTWSTRRTVKRAVRSGTKLWGTKHFYNQQHQENNWGT